MQHQRPSIQSQQRTRAGFTLVEMLVSVALILVILTIMSTMFSLATQTIGAQRGIASNDQRARSLVTLIRRDFAKRTQTYVHPFYPTEDTLSTTEFDSRQGYLYISTNDPASYQDDIIQFTVDAGLLTEDEDGTKYRGASSVLAVLGGNPNQPEADDGLITANGIAESDKAEIALFMRNGKLYRRVSLIREPLRFLEQYGATEKPAAGTQGTGADLFVDSGVGGLFTMLSGTSDDFYRFFDFSVEPFNSVTAADLNAPTSVVFLGATALDNSLVSGSMLGNPQYRFGFNPMTGFSREHSNQNVHRFLGRFLQAETSDPDFNWPWAPSTAPGTHGGNPMDLIGEDINHNGMLDSGEDLDTDGLLTPGFSVTLVPNSSLGGGADVVDEFVGNGRGGERRMEDLLLSNVHEFRIELWDGVLNRFVVPGYGAAGDSDAAVGEYHIRRNLQYDAVDGFQYGPLVKAQTSRIPAVYDTWHPDVPFDFDVDGNVEISETQPPYIAYVYNPPNQTETPPGPSSPLAPAGDATYWLASTAYAVGDVVFAWDGTAAAGWDNNADTLFQWDLDAAAIPDQAFQTAYICTVAGTSDATPPAWPTNPGNTVVETGGVTWESFDNRRPLQAVRLTVRFLDPPSGQIRQLSMIISLTDD